MKKTILFTLITAIFVSAFTIIKRTKNQAVQYTIGILQTASHPALDASHDGFIEELKDKIGNSIEFVIQNAQGSISQAHTIAQQFHANKQYSGFFAIATPAAQAISAIEKKKPIFIAAVTDPQALGLISPTTNVCGVKDMINVKAEIEMLKQLVPNAKTIGIIYTTGEINSIALTKQMRIELEALGLNVIDFGISNESDVQAIVELACRKTDLILAPTDNTVASTITLIAAITLKHKKPLIVSDNMLVKFGALAARGIDYKASGKKAAQIAYKVLKQVNLPYELPVEQAQSEQIFINENTLKSLGLEIPETLKEQVTLVS